MTDQTTDNTNNADEGPTVDPTNVSAKEATFAVYDKALKNAEWKYPSLKGTERDLAHKSVIIAERAYVSASIYDQERANQMYELSNGRPPSPDLILRGKNANENKQGPSLPDLTAGMSALKDQGDAWQKIQQKAEGEKQIDSWRISLGDADERAKKHRRAANEELMKGEQEDRTGSGLHILTAIKKGFSAGHEYRDWISQSWRARQLNGKIVDQHKLIGKVQGEIAAYDSAGTEPGGPTTGDVGKTSSRFSGAMNKVSNVMNTMRKKAGPGVHQDPAKDAGVDRSAGVDKGAGDKGAGVTNPPKSIAPAIMDAIRRNQQGQGPNVGM